MSVLSERLATLIGYIYNRLSRNGLLRESAVENGECQEKLARLQQLVSGMVHDIKMPATALSARLYAAQKELSSGSIAYNDLAAAHLAEARKDLKKLAEVIRGCLDRFRPHEPKLTNFDVALLLKEVLNLYSPSLKAEGIEMRCEAKVNVQVLADFEQLRQVLVALVKNAAESISQGGTIILAAERGSKRLNGHRHDVIFLQVKDTGSGIRPSIQSKIFDPLFSTKPYGHGLGLAIAQGIVGKHGGRISFQTEVNRGSTFTVTLPISNEAGTSQNPNR